ncbi:glutathione S-transferase family protein [Rhodanobacter sp. L36]|uniref:glutathione S-transferase family protein n=1 Tax=Rhodanobacter sp. L36 TaxID=1747221 RepID=UPI00131E047E|nr:glutathione S-transferase family protein [Rhodanobacter sp. L36]
MAIQFYGHPFSSYTQKALIALYENDTPFKWRMLTHDDPATGEEFAQRWPLKRFPIIVDGDRTVMEASIVIEYLGAHHPAPVRLIPADADAAIEVRMLDRFFDNYISGSLQKIVLDSLRPETDRDGAGVRDARAMLDIAYIWLDAAMAGRTWASGDDFTLADCSAAPSLFYADWTHPIPDALVHLKSYRQRLLARPSFARAVDEARPYRSYFPLGAPDRD